MHNHCTRQAPKQHGYVERQHKLYRTKCELLVERHGVIILVTYVMRSPGQFGPWNVRSKWQGMPSFVTSNMMGLPNTATFAGFLR